MSGADIIGLTVLIGFCLIGALAAIWLCWPPEDGDE